MAIRLRITVAERALSQDAVEFKIRTEKDRFTVPLSDAVSKAMEILLKLDRDIAQTVVNEPYRE